ncbi:MAG: protein-glutamate O-methyltransferase CheR [Candidatus Eremiobacterota bacterium]
MADLTLEDYQFVAGYLERESGIQLGADKQYLVKNRLEELCARLGVPRVTDLIARVRQRACPVTARSVVEAMTTNETSFFRDGSPFEALRTQILPELLARRQASRSLRIWSAACSTGQEPYSVAMLLHDSFAHVVRDWQLQVLGIDLAEKVVERARSGRYTQLEVNRGLPVRYLLSCFEKKGSDWVVAERLRRLVRFEVANLVDPALTLGTFDLILCRNVMIYFEPDTRRRVLGTLLRHLAPDGYLIVGGAEVLLGLTDRLERLNVGGAVVYRPVHG